jgi:hypothetical protein
VRSIIYPIETGAEPSFPCWLFLPECKEWQWFESSLPADYTKVVMSHWSPGGRPESPHSQPNKHILMTPTGTELRVCEDIAKRQSLGIAKYGTTVESNPLTLKQWLQHAYLETLDKAIYLKRAIEEMDK